MNEKIKSCELVKASSYEEFYYSDSDAPVEEGEPIGVDLELGEKIKFVLFDGIYWGGGNEKDNINKEKSLS